MAFQSRRGCFLCGDNHLAAVCPSGERLCFNCKSSEHEAAACPEPRVVSNVGKACHLCGGIGHLQANCPSQAQAAFPAGGAPAPAFAGRGGFAGRGRGGRGGSAAGGRGGLAQGAGGAPKTVICYNCNGANHLARDCTAAPEPRVQAPKACHRCAALDHLARECPTNDEIAA